jgi:hypothetical protein
MNDELEIIPEGLGESRRPLRIASAPDDILTEHPHNERLGALSQDQPVRLQALFKITVKFKLFMKENTYILVYWKLPGISHGMTLMPSSTVVPLIQTLLSRDGHNGVFT